MALSMTGKIAIGWSIAIFSGLYSFYLSRKYIDNHRYEAMKARHRTAAAGKEKISPEEFELLK